jgi:hypothetical protein
VLALAALFFFVAAPALALRAIRWVAADVWERFLKSVNAGRARSNMASVLLRS